MSLKRLTSRHRAIMRRLIEGERPSEICAEVGLSESRLSILRSDPLFKAELEKLENEVTSDFIEAQSDAMEILMDTAPDAALLTQEAVCEGTLLGKTLAPKQILESAFDVLNRTGIKKMEQRLHGHIDLTELIRDAYKKKYNGGNEPPKALLDVTPESSEQLTLFDD